MSRGRAGLPGRPQRLGQVDAAEDRGRADRARPRRGVRAAGRDAPLSAAGAGFRRLRRRRSPMSRPGLGAATTIRIRRAICSSSSASPARRTPRSSPAAKRAAPRWRACWRPSPTSCCSTSRPTISTSPTIEWLERELDARRARARDDQPRPALSRQPVAQHGLARPRADAAPRARLRRLRGLARRRSWRRRSATSTSSTARSSPRSTGCATASPRGASATCGGSRSCKRCARRAATIAAPPARPTITAERGRAVRRAGDRGEGHRQELSASARSCATSRPASCAATASASSGRTAAARPR